MKTNLFALIFLFIAICSFGQIRYENGYYIDNNNRRTECLIKNVDWKNNPNEFIFKKDNSSISEKGNILSIKEFGIYGFSKFIRVNIAIDRSSDYIDRLTYEKNPIWSNEQLFLRLIVEGKASLYYYEDGNLMRFFYSIADTSINQLICKKYLDDNANIAYNNGFRQQLWIDVRCAKTSLGTVQNINYTTNDLEKYFTNYNNCLGDSIVHVSNKTKREIFNFKIALGFNVSSISMFNSISNNKDLAFKNNLSFRLGIESELILPINKNKWGIIIEPTFQYFNSEKKISTETATIKYKSVEFPIGIRQYFFLNEDLKVFLNSFFISNYCMNFKSKINIDNTTALDIVARNSFAFGGGIEYKSISAEFRYYTNRELLGDYMYWSSNYNRFSVILGYKIIKTRHNIQS